MKQVAPIKPSQIAKRQNSSIPGEVIETFNEIITEKYSGLSARVTQEEVIERLVKKGLKREVIYEKRWLDVEDIFRKSGWDVEYDKPGFNESYGAYFVFNSRRLSD